MGYWNDSRVVAGETAKWWVDLDEEKMVAVTAFLNDDEEPFETPFEWAVCPTCEGKGKHVNPSIDADGISAEELMNDEDFAAAYRGGIYDVPCYECHGKRVVPELPEDSPARLHYEQHAREEREYQSICAAERAMGA